jgi:hypothetical protein
MNLNEKTTVDNCPKKRFDSYPQIRDAFIQGKGRSVFRTASPLILRFDDIAPSVSALGAFFVCRVS